MQRVVTLPNRKPFSTQYHRLYPGYSRVVTLPNRKPFSTDSMGSVIVEVFSRNPSESEAIFNNKRRKDV